MRSYIPNPERRILAALFFAAFVAGALMFVFPGCSSDGWTPTGASNPSGVVSSGPQHQQTGSTGSSPASPPASGQCNGQEILRDQAKTLQSIHVDGQVVSGTCYATTELEGALFCKVYLDARGGSPNTQADVGEEWSLVLPDFEEHLLVIDFEVDVDGDGATDCQNDGTKTTVKAKPPTTTTVPPSCDPVLLRELAGEECGELGFELNLEACTFTCGPEVCKPQGEPDGENCSWNSELCRWDCEPECSEDEVLVEGQCVPFCEVYPDADKCQPQGCVPPEEQGFELENPIGNPTAECSYFGYFVPVEHGADFYIKKCGLGYDVTHDFPGFGPCQVNGKDKSHITKCACPRDDD